MDRPTFLELQKNMIDDLIIDSEIAIELFPTNSTFYYLNPCLIILERVSKVIESINIGVNFVVDNPTLIHQKCTCLGNSYNEIKEYEKSDISYEKSIDFYQKMLVLNNYIYSL